MLVNVRRRQMPSNSALLSGVFAGETNTPSCYIILQMLEKSERQLTELQEKYDSCPKPETMQRYSS